MILLHTFCIFRHLKSFNNCVIYYHVFYCSGDCNLYVNINIESARCTPQYEIRRFFFIWFCVHNKLKISEKNYKLPELIVQKEKKKYIYSLMRATLYHFLSNKDCKKTEKIMTPPTCTSGRKSES